MSVQDRILELIEAKGLNKNSFSNLIHIQPQTLHHIVSGRRTNPSFEIVQKIVSTFSDIDSRWLITGEGNMYIVNESGQRSIEPPGFMKEVACPMKTEVCELCKEKDRTIAAMDRTIRAQDIAIESLQGKIEELTYPQRGQKRKVG